MGWGLDQYALVRIPVKRACKGYYLRWYYNGFHYWFFLPGTLTYVTEGEQYRTIGTREIRMCSGQVTRGQCAAIRTIMNTREVALLTIAGWMNIRIKPGTVNIYDNQLAGNEIEFIATVGSKEISYVDGYSPVGFVREVASGTTYCELMIGNQIWACKNFDSAYPGSKVYGDNEAYRAIYGGLYTWNQIMNPGFCPAGWHVPTLADWQQLINFVGNDATAGGILKEINFAHWSVPNTGAVDTYGFAALGSGYYDIIAGFIGMLNYTPLWTATSLYAGTAETKQLAYNSAAIAQYSRDKTHFMPVRLIKDNALERVFDIDGNYYDVIRIGNQEWLGQNLQVEHYGDGAPIPHILAYNDWFLPSKDELHLMHTVLATAGIGNFTTGTYMSSSEFNATLVWAEIIHAGFQGQNVKNEPNRCLRAIRAFTSTNTYALGDWGQGGYVIWHVGNDYLEAAPCDGIFNHVWSNVLAVLVGTGTAIGTGAANTAAIIAQPGHIDSAALECDNLTGDILWTDDTCGAYCYYNNDPLNKAIYGALYNWHAVNNAHGLVYFEKYGVQQTGWRMPTETDFAALSAYFGGDAIAGEHLKETGVTHWTAPNPADNISQLTALGTGYRIAVGFGQLTQYGYFWTSQEDPGDPTRGLNRQLRWLDGQFANGNALKYIGQTIRCVRDV